MSVATAETQAEQLSERNHPNIAERLYHRSVLVGRMVGVMGIANTAQCIYGRIANGQERQVEIDDNPELRFPVQITSMPSDIGNYMEIFRRKVYDLPSLLDRKVNGRDIVDLGAYIGLSATRFASRYLTPMC